MEAETSKSCPTSNGSRFSHLADLDGVEEVDMEVENLTAEEANEADLHQSKNRAEARKESSTAK